MVSPATKPAALAAGLGLALLLSAPGLSTPARADGDVAAGHAKAKRCATCHGIDGKAKLPDAPNLAGQNPIYLVAALNAYKSGARKNDMMSLVAPKLSDQDIADLAAYYASLGTPAAK